MKTIRKLTTRCLIFLHYASLIAIALLSICIVLLINERGPRKRWLSFEEYYFTPTDRTKWIWEKHEFRVSNIHFNIKFQTNLAINSYITIKRDESVGKEPIKQWRIIELGPIYSTSHKVGTGYDPNPPYFLKIIRDGYDPRSPQPIVSQSSLYIISFHWTFLLFLLVILALFTLIDKSARMRAFANYSNLFKWLMRVIGLSKKNKPRGFEVETKASSESK